MNKKMIMYIIIVLLTGLQCIFMFINNNLDEIHKNDTVETSITEEKNAKYIKEIENDFRRIKNLEVISYNNSNNQWKIKAEIKGNKKEVQDTLKELYVYDIESYSLKYIDNKISLELDLVSN